MRIASVILLAAVAAAPSAGAQQPTDTTALQPIVISATRVPMRHDVAPATVTVLRGDELRVHGLATVGDALATVPGLAVVRSGSFGATTSLFVRGAESDYMKVLIDGVPVNAPGGAFDFSTLTTDNLDRIEVVRGPSSAVYGADAVAGVIQLFTRAGVGPARGSVSLRGGSFGTLETTADVRDGAAGWSYSLAGAARASDGVLAFNNAYRNRTASGRLAFTPGAARIDMTARRTDASYHFPTNGAGQVVDSNAVRRDHRTVLGLDASRDFASRVSLRVLAGASRLDGGSDNAPDSPGDTLDFYSHDDARTDRRSAELRADIRSVPSVVLSAGAALERQQVRSASESRFQTFPATGERFSAHRTTRGAYLQLVGTPMSAVTYTASARVDDDATYGTFGTGRASIAWSIGSRTSVRAAIGNAYKAPAFDETFSSSFTIGNPDLRPERTRSWEVAADRRIGARGLIGATYFHQAFRDLIQYVSGDASTGFRGTNANLAGAVTSGVELEARTVGIAIVEIAVNATLLRTRVTDAGNGAFGTFVDGERLLRRPARTANLTADVHPARGFTLGTAVRYVGARDDRDFAAERRVSLAPYTLVDLHAGLALAAVDHRASPVGLTLRIENALDRRYEPTFGFGAPGRTVLVGATVRLGGAR